ncbi:MAG: hypothetical protein H0V72_20555, partial [Bradyrhizobium sp.]|nr:hypothetical protein [Bradyrhizobium sp.]
MNWILDSKKVDLNDLVAAIIIAVKMPVIGNDEVDPLGVDLLPYVESLKRLVVDAQEKFRGEASKLHWYGNSMGAYKRKYEDNELPIRLAMEDHSDGAEEWKTLFDRGYKRPTAGRPTPNLDNPDGPPSIFLHPVYDLIEKWWVDTLSTKFSPDFGGAD